MEEEVYTVKQYLIIRKDLKMRRGKEIAQACHAALDVFFNKAYFTRYESTVPMWKHALTWFEKGFAKITLQVDTEQELLDLAKKAEEAGIPHSLIRDSGKTEFNNVPTYTVLAIGPWDTEEMKPLVGHLKLY